MDTNNSPSQKPRRIIEGRETRDEYLSEDRTKSRCRNKQKERDKIRLLDHARKVRVAELIVDKIGYSTPDTQREIFGDDLRKGT
ncbi:hypothetical protein CDL15_Pgr024644 [Punica granatum]|uniref:Uncharacterized protein n=1 Tax=Punica granatum TaxID=22663 RepID=A0A218WV11_PUNGR|nr:hypothetical protein CDL15_Pgr024644 [Punica granatum]